MSAPRKKICFVITAQNHYARSILILQELQKRSDIDLSIIVGGSALLHNYGAILEQFKKDGLTCAATIEMVVEGNTPTAMAKTMGLATIEFSSAFSGMAPDLVVVRGDRYEVLAAAVAASYLNIPVAHLEGGDVTGTIDEGVRHAITKLAHLHFVTNDDAYRRVLRMGESRKYVFCVGAPEVEFAARTKGDISSARINRLGVGEHIDIENPFQMVMHHPVTTEYGGNGDNTQILLETIAGLKIPTLWFWPNIDAGSDEVSKTIRTFRETTDSNTPIRFLKGLPPGEFVLLLRKAACLVGNSSAGIKEASYLGTPVVNLGTRQAGRLRGENVIDLTKYTQRAIQQAVRRQLANGPYKSSLIYYQKGSSKKIASILARVSPPVQKKFID